jgi:hypothetical protein
MFGADIVVIKATGFVNGQFDNFLGAGRQANFAHNSAVATTDNKFYGGADFVKFYPQIVKHAGRNSISLAHQTEQQMFGADIIVVEALGFFLGQCQDLTGPFGKFFKPI